MENDDIDENIPRPPPASPENEFGIIELRDCKVEITLKEVAAKVGELKIRIDEARKERTAAVKVREQTTQETQEAQVWRDEQLNQYKIEGEQLDRSIEELEHELSKLVQDYKEKNEKYSKQREVIKKEINQLQQASHHFATFEIQLLQSLDTDSQRLEARMKQIRESHKSDYDEKIAKLKQLHSKQHLKNQKILANLEINVLEQRAIFWENQHLKKVIKESMILSPRNNLEREVQQARHIIMSGDVLTRFLDTSGKRQEFWVQVDAGGKYLCWQSIDQSQGAVALSTKITRIDLTTDIIDIIYGAKSPSFYLELLQKKQSFLKQQQQQQGEEAITTTTAEQQQEQEQSEAEPPLSWLCFSLVTKLGKTIDFMSHDENGVLEWYLGLQGLIPSTTKKDGTLRNKTKTKSNLILKRGLMKIRFYARESNLTLLNYIATKMIDWKEEQRHARKSRAHAASLSTEQALNKNENNSKRLSKDEREKEREKERQKQRKEEEKLLEQSENNQIGVEALRIALEEGIISVHDLKYAPDTVLQSKIVKGVEGNDKLRKLFQNFLKSRQSIAVSNAPSLEEDEEDEETNKNNFVNSLRNFNNNRNDNNNNIDEPKIGQFFDLQGEVGIQLLKLAVEEKIISQSDLENAPDIVLHEKIVKGVHKNEKMQELFRKSQLEINGLENKPIHEAKVSKIDTAALRVVVQEGIVSARGTGRKKQEDVIVQKNNEEKGQDYDDSDDDDDDDDDEEEEEEEEEEESENEKENNK